jgi:hypothetical protein
VGSGDRPKPPAAVWRRADDAKFFLKAVELALATLLIRLGIAKLALGFLGRLVAEIGNGELAAEDVA